MTKYIKCLIFVSIAAVAGQLSTARTPVQNTPEPRVSAAEIVLTEPEPVVPPEPVYTVTGGCEQYRALVSQYSDWDVATMLAIMHYESLDAEGGLPNAVPCNYNAIGDTTLTFYEDGELRGMSCGLAMVRVLRGRPNCEQLHDPKFNIEWAHRVYLGQGYSAWSIYNNGRYLDAINRY